MKTTMHAFDIAINHMHVAKGLYDWNTEGWHLGEDSI